MTRYLLDDKPERILERGEDNTLTAERLAKHGAFRLFLFVDGKDPQLFEKALRENNSDGETVLNVLLKNLDSKESVVSIVVFLTSVVLDEHYSPLDQVNVFAESSKVDHVAQRIMIEFFIDHFVDALRKPSLVNGKAIAANLAMDAASAENWRVLLKIISSVKSEPQLLTGARIVYGKTLRQILQEKGKQDIIKILDEIGMP